MEIDGKTVLEAIVGFAASWGLYKAQRNDAKADAAAKAMEDRMDQLEQKQQDAEVDRAGLKATAIANHEAIKQRLDRLDSNVEGVAADVKALLQQRKQ